MKKLKSLFNKLSFRSQEAQESREDAGREYLAEQLEARVLYSGTVAPDAPVDEEVVHEAPAESEPEAVGADGSPVSAIEAAQQASAEMEQFVSEGIQIAGGETDISEEQDVVILNPEVFGDLGANGGLGALSQEAAQGALDAAAERWSVSGVLTEDQEAALGDVSVQVADLEGDLLLVVSEDNSTILLDIDAAGREWFVDGTPLDDSEFTDRVSLNGFRAESGTATEGVDVLTILMEAQGRLLGVDGVSAGRDVSATGLEEGLRRIPFADEALTNPDEVTTSLVADLANAAAQRWEDSGLNGAQLEALADIEYRVVDLSSGIIGAAEDGVILIDIDAAGKGWFVDLSPQEDSEFAEQLSATSLRASEGAASEGVDLLSVILHEQGHILGLEHVEDSSPVTIMTDLFSEGDRRLLEEGEAEGATPESLDGAHYATVEFESVFVQFEQAAAANNQQGWRVITDGAPPVPGTISGGSFDGVSFTATGTHTRSHTTNYYALVDHTDGDFDNLLSGGVLTNNAGTDITLTLNGLADGHYEITTYHHTPYTFTDGFDFDVLLTDSEVTNSLIHDDEAISFGASVTTAELTSLVTPITISGGNGTATLTFRPGTGFGSSDHLNLNGFQLAEAFGAVDDDYTGTPADEDAVLNVPTALAAETPITLGANTTTDLVAGIINLKDAVSANTFTWTNPGGGGFDIKLTADDITSNTNPGAIINRIASGNHVTLEFFETGTTNPVDVRGLKLTFGDIDPASGVTAEVSGLNITSAAGVTQEVAVDAVFTLPTGLAAVDTNGSGVRDGIKSTQSIGGQNFNAANTGLMDLGDASFHRLSFTVNNEFVVIGNADVSSLKMNDGILANDNFSTSGGPIVGIQGTDSLTGTSDKGAAVAVDPDGSFTYDPIGSDELQSLAAGEETTDTFTYTLSGKPIQIDINSNGSETEPGWTALNVTGPDDNTPSNTNEVNNSKVTVDGVTFEVFTTIGHRDREVATNSELVDDFIYDQGSPNAATGLQVFDLPDGRWKAEVWAWDSSIAPLDVFIAHQTPSGEVIHTTDFKMNPDTPFTFEFDSTGLNNGFGIFVRENNNSDYARMNALRLTQLDTATVTVTVTGTNDDPTATSEAAVNLAENALNGTVVHTVAADDIDSDDDASSLTYAITNGDSQGAFAIDGNGEITVSDNTKLDFDTKSSYSLAVTVTDQHGANGIATITVNLTDAPDNPTITPVTKDLADPNAFEAKLVDGRVQVTIDGELAYDTALADVNEITIDAGNSDDTLTIDEAMALSGLTINFNGQGNASTNPGDRIVIGTGVAATVQSMTYNYTNENDGSIVINDGGADTTINYTGLEPVTATITAADVTLTYTSVSAETITVTDNGTTITADSTEGEITTFNKPTNSLTINGTNGSDTVNVGALTLDADLTINTANVNLNGTIAMVSRDLTINISGTGTAAGVISGTGSLTKLGVGTLTLNGAADTYTGSTLVKAGVLELGSNNASAAFTIESGGRLTALEIAGNFIADTADIQIDAGGTFELRKNETIGGLSGAGNLEMNSASNRNLTVGNGNETSTFSGVISETNSGDLSITKTGSGNLTLSGNNSYSGNTSIDGGKLFAANDSALGVATGFTSVNGGQLHLSGGITTAENVRIDAASGNGALTSASGANTMTGSITLNQGLDVRGPGSLTLSGGVTSATNQGLSLNLNSTIDTNPVDLKTGTLTVTSGTTNLNVAGNNWGLARVNFGGNLKTGVVNALDADAGVEFGWDLINQSTATLDLNGFDQTVDYISQTSNSVNEGGDILITNTGGTAATLTVDLNSGTQTYQGQITGTGANALNLVKSGAGTLVLENLSTSGGNLTDHSYNSTTINGGTLKFLADSTLNGFDGTGAIEAAPNNIVINNGSTLEFEDTGSDNRMSFFLDTVTFGPTGGGKIDFISGNFLMQGPPGTNTFVTTGGAQNIITSSGGSAFFNPQGANTVLFNVADGTDSSGIDLVMDVTINNGHLQKSGTGAMTLTNSTNNLNGDITIDAGSLEIAGSGRLQSGSYAGDISIAGGATFEYNSTADQTLSGLISGAGDVLVNAGLLALTGTNTYAGTTTVNAGQLTVANNSALGTTAGATTVADGAELQLQGGITVSGETVTIEGRGLNFGGALQVAAGSSATWAGDVILDGVNSRIGASGNGTLTVSGEIQDGTGNRLEIVGGGGTGRVIISGTSNSYTGATDLYNGVLAIGADDALPTGTTLDIKESTNGNNTRVDLNGFDLQVAILEASAPASTATRTLEFDVDGTGTVDQLTVTNTVDLETITLDFDVATAPTASVITLIENTGTSAVTDTFTNYDEGEAVTVGTADYFVTYAGDDGNDVVLFAGVAETQVEIDGSGNLVITDINGGTSADDLTISYDGTTDYITISDSALNLTTLNIGAGDLLRPDANTVMLRASLLDGKKITLNSFGGADELTFDISSNLVGGTSGFGAIDVDGGTGSDTLTLDDVYGASFYFGGGDDGQESITINDTHTTGQTNIELNNGGNPDDNETVAVNNAHSGSLRIRAFAGDDTVLINDTNTIGNTLIITNNNSDTVTIAGAGTEENGTTSLNIEDQDSDNGTTDVLNIGGPVGSGSLDNIKVSVTYIGGTGNDTLNINDEANGSGRSIVIDGANTTISAGGNEIVNFDGSMENLNVNTGTGTDTVTIDGDLTIPRNLTINSDYIIMDASAVTTTSGDQTYNGAVELKQDITFDGNDVTFNGTVDSDTGNNHTLTVDADGTTTFAGSVGATDALTSLTTDAAGTTEIGGTGVVSINTTGEQTFNDSVTLTSGVDINISGSGNEVSFGSTVDGPGALNIDTTDGKATFSGNVGDSPALASITASDDTDVVIDGVSFSTVGDQTFNNGVDIGTGTNVDQGTSISTTGGLVLAPTSIFTVQVNGATAAGTDYDQLIVNGDVDLNDAELVIDMDPGYTPAGGDNITLIVNNGPNPVNGIFAGLAEGDIIAFERGGVANALFRMTYEGNDGNDVVLETADTNATTSIHLDGTTLIIGDVDEDVVGGGVTGNDVDSLTLFMDGTELVIRDPNNVLGSIVAGSVQSSFNEVRVDTSLFTDVIVETRNEADSVTVGDLGSGATGLPGSLTIIGGAGQDRFIYNGAGSVLVDGSDFNVTAEIVAFTSGSSLTVGTTGTNTGGITVDAGNDGTAGAGAGTFTGIDLDGASLAVTGDGDVDMTGEGGDTQSRNHGIALDESSILTENGGISLVGTVQATNITQSSGVLLSDSTVGQTGLNATGVIAIDGTSGGTGVGSYNIGVTIDDGSEVIALGDGSIAIDGEGADGGSRSYYNYGVKIARESALSSVDGDVTIDGEAGSGHSYNSGISLIYDSSISVSGSGDIVLSGAGGDGVHRNYGVGLERGVNLETGTGSILLTGTGGSGTGGNESAGVRITDSVVRQTEANATGVIAIDGTGVSGGARNAGVLIDFGSAITALGSTAIDIDGIGADGNTFGFGINIVGASALSSVDGDVTLDGTGGDGTASTASNNMGVSLESDASVTVSGSGDIALRGTGGDGARGYNAGVALHKNGASLETGSGSITLVGIAGGGLNSNYNNGVKITGSSLKQTAAGLTGATITIDGTGSGTGMRNTGVEIDVRSVITALGETIIDIDGVGADGRGYSQGVRIGRLTSLSSVNGNVTIDGEGGDGGRANQGVTVESGSGVTVSGTGGIMVNGTGGDGTGYNTGVTVSSGTGKGFVTNSGAISVTGTSGTGSSSKGLIVGSRSVVQSLAGGSISLSGTSRGSGSQNSGLELSYVTVDTTGDVILFGAGSSTASGYYNRGIYLLYSTIRGNSLNITGNGGTGSNYNEGVRVMGGSLSGDLNLTGTANSATTGRYNTGVYLLRVDLSGAGAGLGIFGTGGGGTGYNHGIHVIGSIYGGSYSGTAGDGTLSEAFKGAFLPPAP